MRNKHDGSTLDSLFEELGELEEVNEMIVTCHLVIPGTFIACGEGGQYCSEECERRAVAVSKYVLLKQRVQQLQAEGRLPLKLTDEERADWAYGNAAIDNPDVTREMAERAVKNAPR